MSSPSLFEKLGRPGRPGDDFPFMGLCIVAGLIALAFLAVLLIDTIRQRRKLARLRPAQTKATKRTAAE